MGKRLQIWHPVINISSAQGYFVRLIVPRGTNKEKTRKSSSICRILLAARAALYLPLWVTDWLTHDSSLRAIDHFLTFLTKPLNYWEQISSHFRISTTGYHGCHGHWGHGGHGGQDRTGQDRTGQAKLASKLDFPGNLCHKLWLAAFAILAMFKVLLPV